MRRRRDLALVRRQRCWHSVPGTRNTSRKDYYNACYLYYDSSSDNVYWNSYCYYFIIIIMVSLVAVT